MKKTMKKSTKGFLNNLLTYAIVIIAFVFTQMALSKMIPGVTISRSLKGQLIPICVYIVMAVSLNLTVGISGELSLGHAGFMSVGAFSGIIMSGWLLNAFQMENETMRLVLAMLTGGVCAAIAGVLIGIPVLRLRGDYLAIVTLAFGEIIRNVMNCLYFAVSDGKLIVNFNNPRIDGTLLYNGPAGAVRVGRIATFEAGFVLVLLTLCPAWGVELPVQAEAALLMEKETGQVLYAKNEHQALEPASVTKVMTLLLVMEAIDRGTLAYDDVVTVSDYAASMGGSQIFLSPGEQITVEDLLKGVCVSSGNDAAVALAEKTAGVTELFVEQMNNRARELGMQDTHFVNCTGLPAEGHVTSAWDIAVMSRELIRRHPDIRRFTTIWMDTLRDGQFQLSNTNKLIRFYEGATGLKTGSTDSARYCISATAERDGMELIAVILKGKTSPERFADAQTLLNYGFASYALKTVIPDEPLPPVPVTLGTQATVQPVLGEENQLLLEKAKTGELSQSVTLESSVQAPVAVGDRLGTLTVTFGEEVLVELPLLAGEEVPRITFRQMLPRVLRIACLVE